MSDAGVDPSPASVGGDRVGGDRIHHELVLVRHAETEWARVGRHTGRSDVPLTDDGREAARQLGLRLRGWRFALVLCSPLARAMESCQLAGLGAQAIPDDRLLEWDYGEYEGLTTAQIRARRPGWNLWRDGCPGGETATDVATRVDRALAAAADAQGDVAMFAHGHVLRVLGARWIGRDPTLGGALALSTASLSVLGHERDTHVLWRWNDTGS